MNNETSLSVVIISKNIEKYIGKCIKSILNETNHIKNKEIILVDSASTDRTVEIAKKYPIRILRIANSVPLSASAGRYIGSMSSKGDFIYFHDGDSIIYKNWLINSLLFLESHKNVAGVIGTITQEEYDNYLIKRWIRENNVQKSGEIKHFEGNILIRREVLEKVGSFNPWIKAREEGELSIRILEAGYKLHRLPIKMVHHLGGEKENMIIFIKRRMIHTYSLGYLFRIHLRNKFIRKAYFNESKYMVYISLTYMLIILSAIVNLFLNYSGLLFFSLAMVILIYFWLILELKNFYQATSIFLGGTVKWPLLILGFLRKPKKIDNYPVNYKVIK